MIKVFKRLILLMMGFRMQESEGHLGGYRLAQNNPGTWCPKVWDWAVQTLGVRSVLDIGCGLGYSLRYFHDKGCDVLGIDGSPSAVANNQLRNHVRLHDYTHGPYVPAKKYDLIWCCEFVEHVDERYLENFLATFKYAGKYIMMTYACPGQGGHHHVNERDEDYWLEKLLSIGYVLDRPATQHARKLVPKYTLTGKHHFRQQGLVFVPGQKRA